MKLNFKIRGRDSRERRDERRKRSELRRNIERRERAEWARDKDVPW